MKAREGSGHLHRRIFNKTRLTIFVRAATLIGFALLSGSPIPALAAPPNAPSNLTAHLGTDGTVTLAWTDNSNNEAGFVIESATNTRFTEDYVAFSVDAPNVTSFVDDSVFPGATFYYRVYAINPEGGSNYSNVAVVSVPPGETTPLAAPTNLQAEVISSNRVDLTWTDNSTDEQGFTIQRATDDAFVHSLTSFQAGANAVSYSDTSVQPGTRYYYRVFAVSQTSESDFSNTADALVLATVPSAPAGLAAVVVSQSRVDLSWQDASSDETGFRLERAINETFTQDLRVVELAAGVVAYTDDAAATGSQYYYRIFAVNSAGASASSNVISVNVTLITPQTPSNLSGSVTSHFQVSLTWNDNSNNEDGFIIERAVSSSFAPVEASFNVAAGVTVYVDTAAARGATYYYRVRAKSSAAGISAPSNSTTVTVPPAAPTSTAPGTTSTKPTTAPPVTTGPTLPSAPSPRITITTPPPAPTQPPHTASTATPPAATQPDKLADVWQLTLHAGMRYVDLTWNDPCNNEQGFNIERSDDGINWINVGSARRNGTSFSDRGVQEQSNVVTRIWAFLFGGLMRGNTYYYRVMAFNSEGIICTSPVASISTK